MAYKIIHTADWHLGQSLHQKSRKEEHQLFIVWLLQFMEQEHINAIIIAGDVFDVANPSIEAMDMYHHFLLAAYRLNVEVIVVGGNHDSAARLNTTGSLLQLLNVHVVGGEATALGKIIPLKNKENNTIEAVIVAVPYLRDGDLRRIAEGEAIKEADSAFATSVKLHYDSLAAKAKCEFENIPLIATAHLYVNGSTTSDASQAHMHKIGSLGYLASHCFSSNYSYIAMGHIHKPQTIKHPENVVVRYSGSPIPLSFSERNDEKELTVIALENISLTYQSVPIPTSRNLVRLKGTPLQIVEAMKNYENNTPLSTWAEVVVTENVNFLEFNKEIEMLASQKNVELLNRILEIPKTIFTHTRAEFVAGADNNPLDDVAEIFKLKCEKQGLDAGNIQQLMPLFDEVYNEVKGSEKV